MAPTETGPAVEGSYLSVTPAAVTYLQLGDRGGVLGGFIDTIGAGAAAPSGNLGATMTSSFSGTVAGQSVTAQFGGDVPSVGQVTPDSLTLPVPQLNGDVTTLAFRSAPLDEFLQVASQLSLQDAATYESGYPMQPGSAADTTVQLDAKTVSGLSDALQTDGTMMSNSVPDLNAPVQGAESALGAAKQPEPAPSDEAVACQDAVNAGDEAAQAAVDEETVAAEAATVAAEAASANADTRALLSADARFETDESADPSMQIFGAVSPDSVQQQIAGIAETESSVVATANSSIDQVNSIAAAAYAAAAADFAGGCSSTVSAPVATPDIPTTYDSY